MRRRRRRTRSRKEREERGGWHVRVVVKFFVTQPPSRLAFSLCFFFSYNFFQRCYKEDILCEGRGKKKVGWEGFGTPQAIVVCLFVRPAPRGGGLGLRKAARGVRAARPTPTPFFCVCAPTLPPPSLHRTRAPTRARAPRVERRGKGKRRRRKRPSRPHRAAPPPRLRPLSPLPPLPPLVAGVVPLV